MNILVTSAHYHLSDKYGSEALWSVEILNHYAKLGHKIFAVAGIVELAQKLDQNINLVFLKNGRSKNPLIEFARKTVYPLFSYFQTLKIYKKLDGNFDIVHHIAPTGNISFDLFFIFRPKNLKAKFLLGPAMIPAKDSDYKSLTRVLGSGNSLVVLPLWLILKLVTPFLHFLFKLTIRNTNYVIAVTNEAKKYYSKFISPSKITVIPVGVNLDKFAKNGRERKGKDLVILAVAYLTYRKGIDLLIKAAAKLFYKKKIKNFRLITVGTGEEEERLKKMTEELRISQIVDFTGFIPNDKVPNFYQKADIFCSPTRYEPYGVNLLEAMAAGLPIVATDVNSVKELVEDAGLFFTKDSVDGLTKQLFTLLTNPELIENLSKKAKNRAQDLYSWDKIVAKYLAL